jgi:hypothetical protein
MFTSVDFELQSALIFDSSNIQYLFHFARIKDYDPVPISTLCENKY